MTAETIAIILNHSIKYGDDKLEKVSLRKPMSGELRGIKLLDILQMDINAYMPLLPRITTPALNEAHINQLDPSDLIQLMTQVHTFFVSADSQMM